MKIEVRDFPLSDYIPKVIPSDWQILQPFGDGYAYKTRDGLRIIASTADYEDGREWLHVSVSRADRLPNWDDLKRVKNVIVGMDRFAYQIFPPASEHVNIHEFCLHLWAPLTGSLPIPNFGAGGTI